MEIIESEKRGEIEKLMREYYVQQGNGCAWALLGLLSGSDNRRFEKLSRVSGIPKNTLIETVGGVQLIVLGSASEQESEARILEEQSKALTRAGTSRLELSKKEGFLELELIMLCANRGMWLNRRKAQQRGNRKQS